MHNYEIQTRNAFIETSKIMIEENIELSHH